IKATEEATKRHALDEFMQDFRVEERSYVRENKSLTMMRKTMVMQERMFFRNIPLSNWIEHEMVVEEGHDMDQLPMQSAFTTSVLPAGGERLPLSKFLDDVKIPHEPAREAGALIAARIPAFGAQ